MTAVKPNAKEIQHTDLLGFPIKVNDFVACNWYDKNLEICIVKRLTPKMLTIRRVIEPRNRVKIYKHRYPKDCIKVDPDSVTMYILSNGSV